MPFYRSPYFYLFLAPLFWSGNFIIGKGVLIEGLGPVTITAIRFSIAALILRAIIGLRPQAPAPLKKEDLPYFILLGFTGVFAFNSLVYFSFVYTSAISAALVYAITPAIIAYLSIRVLGEAVTRVQVSGLVLTILGVGWIITRGDLNVLRTLQFNPGDLLMLVASLAWSVYSVWGRRVMQAYSPLVATFHASRIGLLFLWPAALLEFFLVRGGTLSLPVVLGLLYVGVFASAVSFLVWYAGVNAIGASRAGVFSNIMPLSTAVLSVLFLGETLGLHHVVGGSAVLLGVYLVSGAGYKQVRDTNPVKEEA